MQLINASADVNMADIDGNSALHIAVKAQEEELVEYLLDAGASPALKNKEGKTPMDVSEEGAGLKMKMMGYLQFEAELHRARTEKMAVCLVGEGKRELSGEVSMAFSSRAQGWFLLGLYDEDEQKCEVKLSRDGFRSFSSSRKFPPLASCSVTSAGTCIIAQADGKVYISQDGLKNVECAQECKKGDRIHDMSSLSSNSKLYIVDSSHMYFWDETPTSVSVHGDEESLVLKMYCSRNGGRSFSLVELFIMQALQNGENESECRMMDVGFGGKENELGCVLVQTGQGRSFLVLSEDNGRNWKALQPDKIDGGSQKENVESRSEEESVEGFKIEHGSILQEYSRDREYFNFDEAESALWGEDNDGELRLLSRISEKLLEFLDLLECRRRELQFDIHRCSLRAKEEGSGGGKETGKWIMKKKEFVENEERLQRFLQRVKEKCERNLEGLRKIAELNNMSIEEVDRNLTSKRTDVEDKDKQNRRRSILKEIDKLEISKTRCVEKKKEIENDEAQEKIVMERITQQRIDESWGGCYEHGRRQIATSLLCCGYFLEHVCVADDGTLLVAGAGGVQRSEDQGLSWSRTFKLDVDQTIDRLVRVGNTIFILFNGRIFKSSNSGRTWENLQNIHPHNVAASDIIDFCEESRGFVADHGNNIYMTDDGGVSWEKVFNRSAGLKLRKSLFSVTGYAGKSR